MQPISDDPSSWWIETKPLENLSTVQTIHRTLQVHCLSQRCQESQLQNLTNQDYAQLIVQDNASFLCFCVCDGVGSSFQGDFAARYLGRGLTSWLQTLQHTEWSSSELTEQLQTQLQLWASQAQRELQQEHIPSQTPGLVREVLEELRDDYGSETVFFAGCIRICSRPDQANRPLHTELFLCWMGNVLGHLFLAPDRFILLGDENDTARWSTKAGLRGPFSVWQSGFPHVERLIIYTDGLAPLRHTLADLDQKTLQTHVETLLQQPINDDMTFLSIQWLDQEQPEHHPRPKHVKNRAPTRAAPSVPAHLSCQMVAIDGAWPPLDSCLTRHIFST